MELLDKASALLKDTERFRSTTTGIRELVEAAAIAFRAATERPITVDPPPIGGRLPAPVDPPPIGGKQGTT